jgi:transposase-like protein
MGNKLTPERKLELARKLRKAGYSYKRISKKTGVCVGVLAYNLDERERDRKRAEARKHYKKYAKREKARTTKWRKEHPEGNLRAVCFSLLKRGLRKKTISREEIEMILRGDNG